MKIQTPKPQQLRKKSSSEAGFGLLSVMLFIAIAVGATAAMSTQIQQFVKARLLSDEAKVGQKRNEAVLNFVQQLFNTGTLYYVPGSNTVAASVQGGKGWRFYMASDRAYVEVTVCESIVKNSNSVPTVGAECPANTTPVPVPVAFVGYKVKGKDRFADVTVTSKSGKTSQDSKGVLFLGTTDQKQIERYVSNTDYCFYMKPKSGTGGVQYNGKGTVNKGLHSAVPRPEGSGPDEFGDNYSISAVPENQQKTYGVLKGLRPQLLEQYRKGFRHAEVVTQNFTDQNREVFAGVMPQQGHVGGPQFQYFLAAVEGTWHHLHDLNYWDPNRLKQMKQGCHTTTGDGTPDFCTRVDIPYKSYTSKFDSKCVKKTRNLAPGEVFQVDKRVQATCEPSWPDQVQNYVDQTEGNILAKQGTEYLMEDYIALMEGTHSSQTALKGTVDYYGVPAGWKPPAPKPVAEPVAEAVPAEDKDGKEAKPEKNAVVEEKQQEWIPGPGQIPATSVTYWQVEETQKLTLNNYTATKCVYYKYYNAEDPKNCRVELLTQDKQGWWVCRTHDGCFDENTLIRLSDGSDKKITDLTQSDLVLNPKTGKAMKIKHMTVGPEEKDMVSITIAGGREVKVTQSHPFKTAAGWKKASELSVGIEIEGLGDEVQKIVRVEFYKPHGSPNVVNLYLDAPEGNLDDHFVLANGVATGDLLVQQKLEKGAILP